MTRNQDFGVGVFKLAPGRSRSAWGLVSATPFLAGTLVATALAVGPTIQASPHAVHRGNLVRVHGVVPGCPLGDQVTLISRAFAHTHDFAGVPAVYARVRSGGSYSVSTRIPVSRRPGSYSITGRCGGGNLGVSASLRVLR